MAPTPEAQPRTSSRAADCSSVKMTDTVGSLGSASGLLSCRSPLERVLIVPAMQRQVDSGSRTVRSNSAVASAEVRRWIRFQPRAGDAGLGSHRVGAGLGGPAGRRKRILDATLAIASKGIRGGADARGRRPRRRRSGNAVPVLPLRVHLLVSALGREFERIDAKTDRTAVSGGRLTSD